MRGMASDQVAQILRQSGSHIKLIIARPVDPTSDLQVIQNNLTIVPTKSLNDAAELAKQIQQLTLSQQVTILVVASLILTVLIADKSRASSKQ